MRLLSSAIVALSMCASAGAIEIDPDWTIARVWNEETLFAIRLSSPRPPVHGRNLYHINAAMYDAWTTYSPEGRGVYFTEKHVAQDIEADRHEAISYAAYRVLKARFVAGNGPNTAQMQADFDALFATLGYDAGITTTVGDTPAAIGNRIAATILAVCLTDGSNEANNYAPTNGYTVNNIPMPFKIPGTVMANPDNWQQLAFDFLVLQNGEIIGAAIQTVVTPHWNLCAPFAMNDFDRNPQNDLYYDQGPPPLIGSQAMRDQALAMIEHSSVLDIAQGTMVDVSPTNWLNSPLGSYDQPGYGLNPVTGEPYEPHVVNFGDYSRLNAEFWADGADSETPPGHWHVVANLVADNPEFERKLFGEGPSLDPLEWDVKIYLALGGAMHDASVTSWGMKNLYNNARPISFVRYMGQMGQSTSKKLPSYHPNGLPLVPGLIKLVEPEDVLPGGEFEDLANLIYEPLSGEPIGVDTHVGDVVIMSWLGGFYAGTTTGVQVTGPIPGQIYLTDGGWEVGDWVVGVDETPGAANPGLTTPGTLRIVEARNAQNGADSDEYIEIGGPPATSLNGVWLIVIGDEVQTAVPDSQGRIQAAVDLSGHTINANGTFLVGRSSLSLATPDIENLLNLKEIGNTTYALVTDFTGYPGQELDYFDDGVMDVTSWNTVLDAVGLRRNSNAAGIYLGAITVGPVASKTQEYGVGWQLATHWMPYQASNFVTPPFPGYTSGHSTYSRSGAEVLTGMTGSPYFPGGFQEYTLPAGWLKFENGPNEDFTFQWVKYADLADQAGESRIWGGIHPPVDDLPGRVSGYDVGLRVVQRMVALLNGEAVTSDIDGSGDVDVFDMLEVINSFGACATPCPFDIDGSQVVDINDLMLIFENWDIDG